MREYAEAGIATLEITPIYGVQGNERNELSFLSTEWMEALKQTQQLGDELGIDIDMNCGTGWPFGGPTVKTSEAAGKLVTKTELFTIADGGTLTYNVSSPEGNAPLNKVMAYQDNTAIDVTAFVETNTLRWTPPAAGSWRVIAVYNGHTGQQVKRAAPGGEGLVLDHYDSTAVANYLARFDRAFQQSGARWPHSFFNDSYEVYGADWTPRMFDEFLKYRGYRLEDHLPQLLGLEKDANGQVMADYRQTLSDMLLNNFTIQWTRWAHSHGATTRNQGHGSPGNLLDFYAAVDIPEIEGFGLTDFGIRGLRTDPGFISQNLSDYSTLKYASSAAHVMGKPFTSSETFTWLTEHFRTSLSQMKPDLDLMFCAGVNHVFFHGTTYSPPEAQWPGWKFYASIDMSPTNSIWRDAPQLMQYIERCQSFLQMGQPDNDLLVYAPFLDVMHKNTGSYAKPLLLFDINTLSQRMSDLTTCVKNIEAAGLDCDYVSDRQLLDVTFDGQQLVTAGGTRYQALVVPASKYMPADVKAHLDALTAQGARIVWGNKAAQIADTQAVPEALRTQLGLHVIRRSNDTGHHYFIANLSKHDVEGYVSLAVDFQDAYWFDPLTGRIAQATIQHPAPALLACYQRDARTPNTQNPTVYVNLRSGQSAILQTYQSVPSGMGNTNDAFPFASSQSLVEAAPRTIDTEWTLTLPESSTYHLTSLSGWQVLDGYSAQFMGTGIYETVIDVSTHQLQAADAGFRLDLGDVRESARVFVNDVYMGCAWSAPFTLDLPLSAIHEGQNALRIEVTNLPANHIRQIDIDGQQWRIFKDVNLLDIIDGNTSVSGITSYANWQLVPSGLSSPVRLIALRRADSSLQIRQTGFLTEGDDSYPAYVVTLAPGITTSDLRATTDQGEPYTGFTLTANPDDASTATLVVRQPSQGYVCFTTTDSQGRSYAAYLPARGAYSHSASYDFTSAEPPESGWQTFTSQQAISGFTATGKVDWCRSSSNGRQVDDLYSGLHFTSAASTYFFFYPGYGMNLAYDALLTIEATPGTQAVLSYLVGSSSSSSAYVAADSLVLCATCPDGAEAITIDLPSRNSYYIYRCLDVYTPRHAETGLDPAIYEATPPPATYRHQFFDLQGRRVQTPGKGLYLQKGKKVISLRSSFVKTFK